MAVLQAATLACFWALQHLAMRGPTWPAVVTSQLAGNALAKIAPGGARWAGAAVPAARADGAPGNRAVAGLTATNLLTFAVVLALPVFAIPAILRGGVSAGSHEAARGPRSTPLRRAAARRLGSDRVPDLGERGGAARCTR